MSIARRDYILRIIEQFAQALARIMGARRSGNLDEAARLLKETADGIFGSTRSMLDALEPASAATLLSSADKTRIYAALTAEEAELAAARGDAAKARAARRRALELYLEAVRGAQAIEPETREAMAALRGEVDESRLGARYREQLQRLG